MDKNTTISYKSGLVWILSGLVLLIYGFTGLLNYQVPGIEELVSFINSATGPWLYLAAFLAIFIEGLYVIGSVFPGTTLILILAVLVQTNGLIAFLGIIGTMYVGWLLAGVCNIAITHYFSNTRVQRSKIGRTSEEFAGITWFPAFRANMEVAQIIEGRSWLSVFLSSAKIKTLACLGLIGYAYLIPLLIDITQVSNKEGFTSISIVALINFSVGGYKLYHYNKQKTA